MPQPSDPSALSDLTQRVAASLRARSGVLASLAILAGLGVCSRGAWSLFGSQVAADARYAVTRESVTTSPLPPWVRRDVTSEVFALASLDGVLSILASPAALEERLAAAYAAHPWVRRVGAVAKSPPNRIGIELEYRVPLAAVEAGDALLAIDSDGVLLPGEDLPAEAVRYLPRVELPDPVTPAPRAGALWAEPRLAGAVAIIAGMGPSWNELHLYRVRAGRNDSAQTGQRFWSYELVSTGNTVVVWGAAPGFGPPGEKPLDEKLGSLRQAVAKLGPLNSVATSPAMIDVRDRGVAYPRVVMKQGPRVAKREGDANEEGSEVK